VSVVALNFVNNVDRIKIHANNTTILSTSNHTIPSISVKDVSNTRFINNHNVTIGGISNNNNPAHRMIINNNAGTIILNGGNTYEGLALVNEGIVEINNNDHKSNAVIFTNINLLSNAQFDGNVTGDIAFQAGKRLRFSAHNNITGNVNFNGQNGAYT